MKEQNSSRLTEPKNGLVVTKGKGTGEDGWEGKDKGGEKERGCYDYHVECGVGTGRAVQHRADK